jgi:hypothetical protein
VTASADGRKTWSGTVVVAAGAQTATIAIPALEAETSAAHPLPVATAPAPVVDTSTSVDTSASGGGARVAALAIGGAGVVAVGAGVAFMLKSSSERQDATTLCNGDTVNCTGLDKKPQVDDLDHQANRDKLIGVAGLAVGGAAIATGVVLYLTSKKPAPATAFVRPIIAPGTIGVVGRF